MDLPCLKKNSLLKGGHKCSINRLNDSAIYWKTFQSQEMLILEMPLPCCADRLSFLTIVPSVWEFAITRTAGFKPFVVSSIQQALIDQWPDNREKHKYLGCCISLAQELTLLCVNLCIRLVRLKHHCKHMVIFGEVTSFFPTINLF